MDPGETIDAPALMTAGGASEQRILQLAGRRYSLRLEACFWAVLETIAERRGHRLNRLVAEIATRAEGPNLASNLRVFCVEQLRRHEAERRFGADRISVLALLHSAPAPGLLSDGRQRILTANQPFLGWIGLPIEKLLDTPLLSHFRFRLAQGKNFEELWARIASARSGSLTARLVNIEPGRVLAANARLVPVAIPSEEALCLLWVLK
jgi:predicted DNA-binding ribbon-helix-helix protein